MRILQCHNFYRESGGEDQVFADEGRLLESRGHEVIRYTRHNDDVSRMGRWEAARKTFWNRQTFDELRELIRQRRPDVMHCHNTFPLISPSAYAAANAEGVPVVQTLHNYRLLCPAALLLRNGKTCEDCLGKLLAWPSVLHGCYRQSRPATAVIAAMLAVHRVRGTWARRVSRFIALSDFSRRKFIAGGFPADHIAIKPNFVGNDPGPGCGRGDYVLFVGRLSHEKGIRTLLDAWQQHHVPVPLKIIGEGPMAPEVQAAAGRSNIQWLGRRPLDEVLGIMAEAQCLVFPSISYETFGRTIIEAFATATPAVVARMGSGAELVADGRTGYHFEVGNPGDLAAKILQLTSAGEKLIDMRQAARREFEEKYTAEQNYAQLIEIYRQVGAFGHAGGNSPYHPLDRDRRPQEADAEEFSDRELNVGLAAVSAVTVQPQGDVP